MTTYKRKTVSTGKNSRRSTTTSSKGTYTSSTSSGTKSQRTTYTQKSNGQSYTTVTQKMGDGSYSRRRISSYNPKKASKSSSGGLGFGMIVILVIVGFVASLFQ